MAKKIFFFDVDGTLVNIKGEISDSTIRAIGKLQDEGHLCFVCTGRTKCMLSTNILQLGFDGFVLGAGTEIIYQDKQIFYHQLSMEQTERLIKVLNRYQIDFVLEGSEQLYVNESAYTDKRPYFGEFIKSLKEVVIPIEKASDIKVSKVTCITSLQDRDALERALLEVEDFIKPIIHETSEENDIMNGLIELIPIQCDKGTGIHKAIELLDISQDNTYAFGDSNNDLDMFEAVKYSVAMGNGSTLAKAHATYITKGIEEDGIEYGLTMLEL